MATVQRDVPFGTAASGSGQQLLCDVYSPSPSAAGFAELPDGQRAGMLVVHGGGWFIGEKEQLEGYARGLSDMGYVCVSCLQQLRPADRGCERHGRRPRHQLLHERHQLDGCLFRHERYGLEARC
jgi:hypothetical protein